MKWQHHSRKNRTGSLRTVLIVVMIVIGLLLAAVGAATWYYQRNLQPVSSNPTSVEVTISDGLTLSQIAEQLKAEGLIRDTRALNTTSNSNAASVISWPGHMFLAPANLYHLSSPS